MAMGAPTIDSLIPPSQFLLAKPRVYQLFKNCPTLMETRKFATVFTIPAKILLCINYTARSVFLTEIFTAARALALPRDSQRTMKQWQTGISGDYSDNTISVTLT
jgi:hypothetical protein